PSASQVYTLSLHDALPILGGLPPCGKSTPVIGGGLLFLGVPDIMLEPSAERRNPDGAARFYAKNAACLMAVRPGSTGEVMQANIDRKSTRLNSSHVSISYA